MDKIGMNKAGIATFWLAVVVACTAGSTAASASASKIFPSRLPLVIQGVITSNRPENSVVLLQNTESGALFAVRSGFQLFRDWTVYKIPSTKTIILKHIDRLEFLGSAPPDYEVVEP